MMPPVQTTLLPSAARTATVTGADQVNLGHRGVHIVINTTAYTAAASVTVKIQGKSASGIYYDILAAAAISATGTLTLLVYPGATASANVSISDALPAVWRIVSTAADSKSVTYSVDADLLI